MEKNTVSVVRFNSEALKQDAKVFVYGRASITESEGKLLLEKMIPFSEVPGKVYIQMENKEAYEKDNSSLYEIIDRYPGNDEVIIVLKEEKMMNDVLNTKYQILNINVLKIRVRL